MQTHRLGQDPAFPALSLPNPGRDEDGAHHMSCANFCISVIPFYAEYVVVPAEAVAAMPDDLRADEAAPLLCAGITVFNSMRHAGATAGDLVAVQGIGGLGHLGIQYARQMGFRTVAIARGKDKEELAKKLGARFYIDSESSNPAAELAKLGLAKVILSTVTSSKAVNAVLDGLAINGKLILVGNPDAPIVIPGRLLIGGRRAISGWPSGSPIDSQDTLSFSALSSVRPLVEVFPLERAAEAYERMLSGKARFRVVLSTGN